MASDNVGEFCHCLRQTIWTVAVRSMTILGERAIRIDTFDIMRVLFRWRPDVDRI